jgi:hypothetical protein
LSQSNRKGSLIDKILIWDFSFTFCFGFFWLRYCSAGYAT